MKKITRKKGFSALEDKKLRKSFKKTEFPRINAKNNLKNVNIKELTKTIEHEPALIRIGKNGITENIITETINLLKLKKVVKIKILPNAPFEDSKIAFKDLEKKTGQKLLKVKGNTALFTYKKYK